VNHPSKPTGAIRSIGYNRPKIGGPTGSGIRETVVQRGNQSHGAPIPDVDSALTD
jgi:hypothetical protein